jgi:hypothetical protein
MHDAFSLARSAVRPNRAAMHDNMLVQVDCKYTQHVDPGMRFCEDGVRRGFDAGAARFVLDGYGPY